jgi:AraC family transcriptional regulator, regulatory protein of adaptative response / methylated-DNA-[protein]-cysteine methyltransferase
MERMDEIMMWQAVLNRDAARDGGFVYAVRSTGIYCRPSCPSRRPARRQVTFFSQPEAAEQAGFRPCKRCCPGEATAGDPQVDLARVVCDYIDRHVDGDVTLAALGRSFNTSPHHLQRTFKRVVGVSPQEYAETCRMARLRASLQAGEDISGTAYGVGFGSISRVYSKANGQLGMTPHTYRIGGFGMHIRYALTDCPLGRLLVAATGRGICAVKLGDADVELEQLLEDEFRHAIRSRDDAGLGAWVTAIVAYLEGSNPHLELPLDVQATAFQRQVWQALQRIPYGETRTYSEVAALIGRPSAVRAVAHACAQNPVALVVPCHRVLRKGGELGGYRWGLARKAELLRRESAG